MEKPKMERRRMLRWLAGLVLLVGLGGAALAYRAAGQEADGAVRYEVIDGVAYPTRLGDTKQYSRQMELYGGKGLVLVDALREWFAALWHGKPLAFVIAILSVVIAGMLYHSANAPETSWPQDEPQDGDDPGR